METLKYLTSDCVVLSVVHIGLFVLLAYALCNTKKKAKPITTNVTINSMENPDKELKRYAFKTFPAEIKETLGQDGWAAFPLVYGFLSVLLLQVLGVAEVAKGYKVLVTVIDLGIILYLCFFNYWFRKKILALVSMSREL